MKQLQKSSVSVQQAFFGRGKNVEWKSKYSKAMQEYKLNLKIQSHYIHSM